ncbi:MAG: UvrD-helicase domain-containing protein, partial [Monoglobales bacterium]
MFSLTEKQKEAVYTRDCDILVSAAAGSGKTAVLSERVLQTVTDTKRPVSVTDFLIVTFTNAAASEMKERIGKKIMEAASDPSTPAEVRNHLKRQITLLGKASITTIHSFCLDIIKNNFHLVDIDPSVRIADKTESDILKMQAAEEMLEKMYAENGEAFSHLSKWLGNGSDERLVSELLDIYNF